MVQKLAIFILLILQNGAWAENLDPYIAGFKKDLDTYQQIKLFDQYPIENLQIRFESLAMGRAAYCSPYQEPRAIVVNTKEWDHFSSDDDKTAMLYHELGHCILNKDHVEGMVKYKGRTIPKSLMRPDVVPGLYFAKFREYYLKELFNVGVLPEEASTDQLFDSLTTVLLSPHRKPN